MESPVASFSASRGYGPVGAGRVSKGSSRPCGAIEYLQLDPLQIIARSHDIMLHSRVLGYAPSLWEEVTYQQRKFFDWGGWLAVRAMEELPVLAGGNAPRT